MRGWVVDELTGKNRTKPAQVVHFGALILILLAVIAWLGEGQHRVRGALSFAAQSAFSVIDGQWEPVPPQPAPEKGPLPAAPAPALSAEQKAVLTALVVKTGNTALTAEEAAVLASAIAPHSAATTEIVSSQVPSSQDAVIDSLIRRARERGRLSTEEQGWLTAAIARIPDPAPDAAGQKAAAGTDRESTDGGPPPVRTPADILAERKGTIQAEFANALSDKTAGILELGSLDLALSAPSIGLLLLAIWRLRQGMLGALRFGPRSERATRRFDQAARTASVAVMLNLALCGLVMAQLGAMVTPGGWSWRTSEPPAILGMLALAAGLWWGVPRLLRLKFKPAKRKRDLEREVEALKARAEALAQENSQFI